MKNQGKIFEENLSPNYKVYIHINKFNKKTYIGITKQKIEKRWKNGKGYLGCNLFYKAIQKYGWDNFEHKILFEDLTKEQAEKKEIEFIKYYSSNNPNFGYNINNGGNCVGTLSEETKKKISQKHLGKKYSMKTREKISKANIKRFKNKKNHPMFNKKHKKNSIEKMRKAHLKNIPILQYDLDGNFIKEWKNLQEIKEKLKIDINHIGSVVNGNQLSSHKYIWRYKNNNNLPIKKYITKRMKQVNQYDLQGNYVKTWNKMVDIKKELGFNISHISQCCNFKRNKAYNYIWRYNND